jgi:hypothetical protein
VPSRNDPLKGIWSPNRRLLNDLRKFESSISTVTGDGDKLRFEVKIERSDPCYHVCHCVSDERRVVFGSERFVHATMDGPEIFRQTQLEQQVIVSNYRETKCPGLKLEPKELLVLDIDRGLIPYGIPEWEGEQEDRVLTIRRIGYVLVVRINLHDLAGVLEYLRDCDLIKETPTTEQFAHIHDGHVEECLESCAGFSRDRSRRVVLGFTNPRPSLEYRVLGNSRSSFADQLQQTCERMQEIKRILIRRLARSASA